MSFWDNIMEEMMDISADYFSSVSFLYKQIFTSVCHQGVRHWNTPEIEKKPIKLRRQTAIDKLLLVAILAA